STAGQAHLAHAALHGIAVPAYLFSPAVHSPNELLSMEHRGNCFSNIVCKKADIDINKRVGELATEELERLMMVVANPRQFKVPDWFLNRKNYKDDRF
ncbi:hypothetical protein ACJX0J_013232, partial [Zea mays]